MLTKIQKTDLERIIVIRHLICTLERLEKTHKDMTQEEMEKEMGLMQEWFNYLNSPVLVEVEREDTLEEVAIDKE